MAYYVARTAAASAIGRTQEEARAKLGANANDTVQLAHVYEPYPVTEYTDEELLALRDKLWAEAAHAHDAQDYGLRKVCTEEMGRLEREMKRRAKR